MNNQFYRQGTPQKVQLENGKYAELTYDEARHAESNLGSAVKESEMRKYPELMQAHDPPPVRLTPRQNNQQQESDCCILL